MRQEQQRYDNVLFEFLSAGHEADESRGTVIVREHEMVLEVECADDRPYLIVGRTAPGFWAGRHEGLSEDVSVAAKWTRFDDVFIGTWVEGGIDWVFKFRLPQVARTKRVDNI